MRANGSGGPDDVVVRKVDHGWVVGGENVSDLTSAMVLADLFAADHATGDDTGRRVAGGQTAEALGAPGTAGALGTVGAPGALGAPGSVRDSGEEVDEATRLAVTVAQLEHALAARVRVEQAIGVLAERHRLRPREAFDLLRDAARSQRRRVTEIAQDVVASATNPLLLLPEELARKLPEPRPRGRTLRRARHAEQF